MFDQVFLSPQMKRSVIIINKHASPAAEQLKTLGKSQNSLEL